MPPRVAIIVLNYNGTADTLECLRSLTHCTYKNFSVIVVDNASVDADAFAHVVRTEFPHAHIISCSENTGFAGGNNAGIRYALEQGNEYVLLLNNDTTVAPDFIEHVIAAAESDARMGIVGAKIYFHAEPDHIWFNGADFSWVDGGKHYQYGERDNEPNETVVSSTTFVTGCAMLISRAVIEKIGLLEEAFFMYYEDIDYCLRAKRAGFTSCVAPGAHVWHKVSRASTAMGMPRIHYYHIRNALLLTMRNASISVRGGVYIWSVFHYAKQIIKRVVMPKIRETSTMIIRGIEDFWRGRFGKLQE
ncbi:MAG: glycosyltransferase family 2 protein [Candidatus Azambacteria bacterium]|nr:glycosyltransferase family 2 protein [Candidatus Azambacteria bacterium]